MILKRNWKKLLSVLFIFVFFASVVPPGTFEAAAAISDEMQQALNRKKELDAELSKLKEQIAAIQDNVEKYEALANSHAVQMENIKAQIAEIEIIMEELRINLAAAQQELDIKVVELKKAYADFGLRLRAMYMNSSSTTLSVLLGADSFSEFLVAAEYTRRMNEQDAELIDKITKLRDEVTALRDDINKSLADQEDALLEQERLYQEYAALLQQANNELSAAEAYEAATQEDYDRLYDDYVAQQDIINNLMTTGSDVPYVGGDFRWPVPNFDWISSPYGWRTLWGRDNFHAGIDIAGSGIYGAGVVASNKGTVHTTMYGSTGYGYYVILDHGGGQMTLYGHLSSIYVTEGAPVLQGDVIGGVGSTGNSTGPHLHFEIRINGEKIDPETLVLRY